MFEEKEIKELTCPHCKKGIMKVGRAELECDGQSLLGNPIFYYCLKCKKILGGK